MTPAQLELIGQRIWGENWKSPLARAIGYQYNAVNDYAAGRSLIPRVVAFAIYHLDALPVKARGLGLTASQARKNLRVKTALPQTDLPRWS